ncbi:MAG TPA: hypothetical protein VIT38_09940 [Allosphingosinicella sp.]
MRLVPIGIAAITLAASGFAVPAFAQYGGSPYQQVDGAPPPSGKPGLSDLRDQLDAEPSADPYNQYQADPRDGPDDRYDPSAEAEPDDRYDQDFDRDRDPDPDQDFDPEEDARIGPNSPYQPGAPGMYGPPGAGYPGEAYGRPGEFYDPGKPEGPQGYARMVPGAPEEPYDQYYRGAPVDPRYPEGPPVMAGPGYRSDGYVRLRPGDHYDPNAPRAGPGPVPYGAYAPRAGPGSYDSYARPAPKDQNGAEMQGYPGEAYDRSGPGSQGGYLQGGPGPHDDADPSDPSFYEAPPVPDDQRGPAGQFYGEGPPPPPPQDR